MMQEPTFEKLAKEAAAGLKADRELYTDITQELTSHLQDKAAHFTKGGHTEEESAELAIKAFGSPLDVAAQLLAANRGRLRLRAALRIAFGALIVPLAIMLALYVGYGRIARIQQAQSSIMLSQDPVKALPTLPFMGAAAPRKDQEILRMEDENGRAEGIRRYWAAHRHEPNSYMYYAYAMQFDPMENEGRLVETVMLGEQIEPDNALYNIMLAEYYLSKGMTAKSQFSKKKYDVVPTDIIEDRRAFKLGIAELQKAVKKPYLHTYQMEILAKKLHARPSPVLTEDYLNNIAVASAILFPGFVRHRDLARKIPGCARLLAFEGKDSEAEAVMDTWRPFTSLLASEESNILISQMVAQACGKILTSEGGEVYDQLGATVKAVDIRAVDKRLATLKEDWRAVGLAENPHADQDIRLHAGRFAGILLPVFGGDTPTLAELTAGRMHEHVVVEEISLQIASLLLVLALVGTLISGAVTLFRHRRSAAVPLLLMPPAREIARAVLLGVLLPVLLYWLYSRLPGIGGREYGWGSGMAIRFAAELGVLMLILLWLPSALIRRYLRRRCDDLGVELPSVKQENGTEWIMRAMAIMAVLFIGYYLATIGSDPSFPVTGICLAAASLLLGWRITAGKRRPFSLYYGTLARSMAPVYALSIIAIALFIQPWFLYQEVSWLKKDTLIFGHQRTVGLRAEFTPIEARASQRLNMMLLEALEEDKG